MFKRTPLKFTALVLLLLCITGSASAKQTLSVYNWSDYIDLEVVAEFEAEFDVQVEFTYFVSDETRDREFTNRDGAEFDVIVVNEVQMGAYIARGWIAPLDHSALPNLAHVDPRWLNAFNGLTVDYGVPYFLGTLGIAWREDLYPGGVTSWRELLEPAPRLSGHIMMNDFGRELVSLALKAEGYSVNTIEHDRIRAAGDMLVKQKPYVSSYGSPALDEESSLVTGDIWVAPMYSGDVLTLMEVDNRIGYRLPDEGTMLWIDYLAVGGQSNRKELAMAFINFLNRPKIAARNAEFVFCATPNLSAKEYVSKEYLANPIIYPTSEQLAKLEILQPLPARSIKRINTVISELRAY